MSMGEDKAALLRSLEIDRSAPPPRPGRGRGRALWPVLGVGLVLAGTGGALFALDRFGAEPPAAVVQPANAGTPAAAPQPAAGTQAQPAPPAQTAQLPAPATAARTQGQLVASGYVVARRMATVSAEVFGRIVEVLVEEGQRVEQGQILARLDDSIASIDLELAKARVQTVEAQRAGVQAELAEAQRVLNRSQALSARDVASEAALTQAQSRVAVLAAELRRLEANLAVSRLDVARQQEQLDKLTIRAPFAGVVVDKNAQTGEIISPNAAGGGFARTGICTIVDVDSLEVEVDVNEAFIGRVQAGQKVDVALDAYPDWRIPGSVIAVVPTANRDKATIKVRIGMDTKDGRVLRDMAAKVTFRDSGA